MSDTSIYKDVLMDHYRKPSNRGDLSDADVVRRGTNPRCGDEVEVGIKLDGETLSDVKFRARGCSICLASASMMTEVVTGKSKADAHRLAEAMRDWFKSDGQVPLESLRPLTAVRQYSARQRCVLLAWEALDDALAAD